MMKIMVRTGCALALVVLATIIAAAQGTGRLDGELRDSQGNPYPDVTVTIKNADNGSSSTTKTDKSGKFTILGLKSGTYNVTLTKESDKLNFEDHVRVSEASDNSYKMNFKEELAKQAAAHPEEAKKKDEDSAKYESMKTHFMAGVAAMNDAKTVKTQLQATPTDQALKDKLNGDYQTADTEFKAAEQAAGPKDVGNHALSWANLGTAEEGIGQTLSDTATAQRKEGKMDDATASAQEATTHFAAAADAFQQAINLKPDPNYYVFLATDLAKGGKFDDASAACDKAVAADPTVASKCWKNLGIVLNNAGKSKEAVAPLQKATTADPKDAQSWWLLGGALSSQMDAKQEGDKMVYTPAPGTLEAYQKCIDTAPTGPYATQCKESMEGIQQLVGGVDTTVGKRAKKKGTGGN